MSNSSSAASGVQLAYPSDYFAPGYATSASNQSSEVDDSYTDKVGGAPMYTNTIPMPPAPTCDYCQSSLFLLTQFYIPATAASNNNNSNTSQSLPSFERVLYVFGCNKYECAEKGDMKSWKVLRIAFGDENDRTRTNAASIATSSAVEAKPTTSAAAVASPAKSTKAASSAASATKTKAVISDDDEWGAKAAWSDDETPAKPASASASAASSSTAVKDTKKAADSDDEWGAKGEWSDDEGDKTKSKKKKDNDDDAVLSALLAKQSLNKAANDAKKLAAEEKAAAKAARKAQAAEEKRIAQEELIKAALEARENAEANNAAGAAPASESNSSSSSSTAEPVAAAASSSCFRPFYLVWTPEPAAAPLELARELRLLKEYEQRRLEEGEKGIFDEESEANSTNMGAGEGEDDDEDDGDLPERREDEEQSFFDRLDRLREQCIRYYGVEVQRKLELFQAPTIPDAAMFMDKKQQNWAEQQISTDKKNPSFTCQSCQRALVMEAQLMPNLLREIHADSINPKDPGMDWTTVDIYSCPNSCNLNKYVEEAIHVQPPL